MTRDRIPTPALFAIATGFGLSSTIQAYWLVSLSGEAYVPRLVPYLLVLNLMYWYVPALLAPLIMAIAVRYQLRGVRWPIQALLHLTGALLYSVIHTAIMLATRSVLLAIVGSPSMPFTWWQIAGRNYLTQLDWLFMTYLFLVGLAHALAYRRESEARALDAAHLETRLVEAQLQALQRQLHPHFLFNTLNTISGLITTNAAAADRMIDRLGDLLRVTLDSSGLQEVTLKQELDVLKTYLEIEQTRFGDRLSVVMRIDPNVLDARVPNLLLQPLVENSIRHGIAPHLRPGWIAVHAGRSGSRLTIEIRDSGDGVPPDKLMALNGGVGLSNTRARLAHLYHAAHQFTFANLSNGFSVSVSIPFEVEPEQALVPAGAA